MKPCSLPDGNHCDEPGANAEAQSRSAADWAEADRAVKLDELGHEYARVYDDTGVAVAFHCIDCKPYRGPFETLRECQDACLEREIEARCGEDGTR